MVTRSVRTDIPGRSTPCVDEPTSRNSIHAPRGSPVMHLEDQAPLLRGCPDRGGERPAREGPTRCAATCGRCKARRVPRQIRTWSLRRNSRCASTHGVDSRRHLVEQAPLLRGCPEGRGEARKGRGPRVAQQRVGRAQARRVPRRIRTWSLRRKSRCASIHGVDSRRHLVKQAPLLRGCPGRGGRTGKGGAHALHSNVWGDWTRRVPRQIKGLPFGSPLSGREIVGCIHAPAPSALRAPGPAYGCPVLLLQNRRTVGVLIPASEVSITTTTACIPERWPEKAAQWAAFVGGEGLSECIHAPSALRAPGPAYGCPVLLLQNVEPSGFSSPIRGVDHYNNRLHPRTLARKAAQWAAFPGGGGFPPRRYKRLPDFESGTFNHSATSPGGPRRPGTRIIRGSEAGDKSFRSTK